MKTRARWGTNTTLSLIALVTVLLAGGCGGGDAKGPSDPGDTSVTADTTPPVDTVSPPTGTRCCPLGNCPLHSACVQGACLPSPAAGECYGDGQCAPGQVCEGATVCACGQEGCEAHPGTCRYPAGCCNADSECEAGQICHEGVCRSVSEGCWRSDQCKPGESCEGTTSCPCGDASCQAHAGTCGLAGVCCLSDAECGPAGVCRGGRCVSPPASPACYLDGDCADGEVCRGEYLCACGSGSGCAVPTTAGRCGAASETCCADNGDCAGGELCVEGRACLPVPSDDQCWVDGHCGVGRTCVGATVCGCDADASCVSEPGECKTSTIECGGDADCPVSMRCVHPDTALCPGAPAPERGVCVEAVDGGCWSGRDDCPPYQRCSGEVVCTDAAGCEAPNSPGLCRPKVRIRDCCTSHDDCEPGTECRNANTSQTCPPDSSAVCLPSPRFGESCWGVDDCPDGFVCNRAWICGCNGKCYRSHEGACETPRFCQTDVDCGSDEVCAKDPECIASPCTTQATCNPGGQCQPRVEGRCWNHNECPDGEYCQGLRICPPDRECIAPDAPGECQPRAGLGGCCSSYRGCEPGLRCVSVASRTGCLLDITAVCVPAITLGLECYADEDCGPGQRCSGALMCPCGVESCTSPPQAGTCVVDN